jgi:hypothetical protein
MTVIISYSLVFPITATVFRYGIGLLLSVLFILRWGKVTPLTNKLLLNVYEFGIVLVNLSMCCD